MSKTKRSSGAFIALEGIDGVGKSTQTRMLAGYLAKQEIAHTLTSEPANTYCEVTQKLRAIILDASFDAQMTPLAREYLFQAARSINLEKVVVPSLEAGNIVISDRGLMSGLAYSRAAGFDRNQSRELQMLTTFDFCMRTGRKPWSIYDLVIVLDGNQDDALERATDKKEFAAGDVIESRGPAYMARVRSELKAFWQKKPNTRDPQWNCPMEVILVDSKSRETVHDEIVAIMQKRGFLNVPESESTAKCMKQENVVPE